MNIQDPETDQVYNWYTAATGGTPVFTGTSFTTPVLAATVTYYAEAELISGGCVSGTRKPVTVNVADTPNAPQIASQGGAICPGSTATLTVTAVTGITVNWYNAATGGMLVFTGNSFTTPALNVTTTYYAEAVNENSDCVSATRTPATVTLIQPLAAPVLTVGETTGTTATFTWTSVNGATGYQISTDGGLGFTPVGDVRSYTVTGLQPNTQVSLIVRASGDILCLLGANSNTATSTTGNPNGSVIFVPNAFTPNGDGNNDILFVYGSIIKSLNFYVYDQWGERIFWSNTQANGWDGTYKGTIMPVGVYVYFAEIVTNDGQKLTKKGTITLIR
ncbi:MAG: gliding motility-associated C-terminal domain-containing protein [Sphingobacteriales bacterium]|nr:MAG: gliding motility-associated C-terminal domain-containing protein [Sphingobacteriales bacterium]